MYHRHQLGKNTEDQALTWFLAKEGYRLIARNYRCRWGEIDLIFEQTIETIKKVELVFVEVRARVEKVWVDGPESVDWKKQKRLQKASSLYLAGYKGSAKSIRFDLLHWNGKIWEHLPDLWFF